MSASAACSAWRQTKLARFISAKAARHRATAVLCAVGRVNTCKAVLVVQLALLRVRKHLVCFVYFLELSSASLSPGL